MKLTVNGDQVEIPNTVKTVTGLLQYLELNQKVIIVEKNAEILGKAKHTETLICHGDKIELVHFVGGG
ncbi:sulfur carrier protein ThiS [Planococcus antarcticus DSM 14505]|uniref:Sulfur carrier protein ThiS n=1 Tax=Planococcus antarcticus DSM 14505 TaxID=1185653 RepID=A0A1C7DDP8_9BACL|nr:sulfur carrier protein ThiS [Planococcus antarcticus]ANU09649.1 thiamine biosynthesis protein ThiS [Planococcus antarcticus DSM 14505]EIM05725.1 sulfur carrier protein ThiS [Planococcus antarcticus DSM 14505]